MSYEQKNNQGSLFENDRITNPTQPQLTGTITIGGRKYRLAAWRKSTRDGKEFLSLKIEEKDRD